MTEEAKEEKPECTLCGLCRTACPVFNITLKETDSPRGKAMLIRKDELDELMYKCTTCGACKVECPIKFELDIVNARAKTIKRIETKANKKMIENIRKHGNPFGKLKKGAKPKELYCC